MISASGLGRSFSDSEMATALLEPLSAIVGIRIAHPADSLHDRCGPFATGPQRMVNDMTGSDERVGAMATPPHLGELIRESMDEVGWNVTETAERLGCDWGTLSRLVDSRACRRTWRWR